MATANIDDLAVTVELDGAAAIRRFGEPLPRALDPRLHAGRRQPEGASDISSALTLDVDLEDGVAIGRREVSHLLHHPCAQGRARRYHLFFGPGGEQLRGVHRGDAPTRVVDDQVPGDAIQPGSDAIRGPQVSEVQVHAHGHVLQQVIDQRRIAHLAKQVPTQLRREAAPQVCGPRSRHARDSGVAQQAGLATV
jgi:hypothetical protein